MIPFVVTEHEGHPVLRDDLLPGGTKQRALPQVLEAIDADEFVLAGPAYGYAQVALAVSAREVGKTAVYYVALRNEFHEYTCRAMRAGLRVHEVPAGRLSVLQARAREYAAEHGAHLLPLGFDMLDFEEALVDALWGTGRMPVEMWNAPELWVTAGTGTLARAIAEYLPATCRLNVVGVGRPPTLPADCDYWEAPQPFASEARTLPPFPSAPNYDAKAWRLMLEHGHPEAAFWNVAG